MSAANLSERIDQSIADGRLVKVTRRQGWERLEGSIVARSSKWLLLALEYDAGFNGHALVRVSDVRRIERYPSSSFVERALAREGHWALPELAGVNLSSTRTALESLAASQVLVAIHDEQDHPNECLIGVPRDFGRKKFRLQNVGTDAQWDAEDSVHRYRSVSRIDVGNAYERRLAAIAGPPPTDRPFRGEHAFRRTTVEQRTHAGCHAVGA